MRALVVFGHPSLESYGAALYSTACEALRDNGNEVRTLDLYREGFDPVMATEEWHSYLSDTERNVAGMSDHVESLLWAEGLFLVFPTWMYGPPAMLKGWLERVMLPGIAFTVSEQSQGRVVGKLHNIRAFTVITTSGSPWWWLRLIGDPGRGMLARGVTRMFHPRCKKTWLQLHDMNHVSEQDRDRFLAKVKTTLAAT